MSPFDEIFQFTEDIVTVKMMYALGRGNKKITDKLVHTGIVGSILAGIIADIIGTIIVFIQPARDFLRVLAWKTRCYYIQTTASSLVTITLVILFRYGC
jgi:hypothetical protein